MVEKTIIDIGQREYGITSAHDNKSILFTAGVTTCTVLSGYEKEQKIGFMCHFDCPCTATSVKKLIKQLKEKHLPEDHLFEARIDGGWCFLWSPCTRHLIRKMVKTYAKREGLNIQVLEGKYNTFRTKAFKLDTMNGRFTSRNNREFLKERGKMKSPRFSSIKDFFRLICCWQLQLVNHGKPEDMNQHLSA